MDTNNVKVGFVGAGNMAYAIAKALVSSGVVKAENIIASARTRTRLDTCWKDLGTQTTLDNTEVVKFAQVIFLSVKPHLICGVIEQCKTVTDKDKLYVSVAAGITLDTMRETFGGPTRIVRTMPNTPCMVECGVVVYALNKDCIPNDGVLIKILFAPIGLIEEIPENQIDSVTSLMGCSIAWFQMVIESMADGGVKNGVPRALAYKLVSKSMEGAAKLVLETGNAPGVLKDQVTSPGGSTICGLYELEQSGVRGAFMKAVDAATKRNKELGKK